MNESRCALPSIEESAPEQPALSHRLEARPERGATAVPLCEVTEIDGERYGIVIVPDT